MHLNKSLRGKKNLKKSPDHFENLLLENVFLGSRDSTGNGSEEKDCKRIK